MSRTVLGQKLHRVLADSTFCKGFASPFHQPGLVFDDCLWYEGGCPPIVCDIDSRKQNNMSRNVCQQQLEKHFFHHRTMRVRKHVSPYLCSEYEIFVIHNDFVLGGGTCSCSPNNIQFKKFSAKGACKFVFFWYPLSVGWFSDERRKNKKIMNFISGIINFQRSLMIITNV